MSLFGYYLAKHGAKELRWDKRPKVTFAETIKNTSHHPTEIILSEIAERAVKGKYSGKVIGITCNSRSKTSVQVKFEDENGIHYRVLRDLPEYERS